MAKVVVVGGPCIDEYYRWDHYPKLGDKINSYFIKAVPGGIMANAAAVIGSLGNDCQILCNLGDDDYTELLLDTLHDGHVKTDCVHVSKKARTLKLPIMMVGSERMIIVLVFEDEFPFDCTPECMKLLEAADCVYTNIVDLKRVKGYEALLSHLREKKIKIMMDAESSTFDSYESERLFFDAADVLSFNDFSLEKFTGETGPAAEEAVARFIGQSDKIVLMTQGAKGCIIRTRNERVEIPAFPVDVVDTTGAGDTFNGAFLHRLLRGDTLRDAGTFAAAAAARCITIMDPRAGAASEAAVREFMQAFGARKEL